MNKVIILFFSLLFITNVHSQNEQAINITTTGTGLTKNNAINDALRNALEQTYGGFISSKPILLMMSCLMMKLWQLLVVKFMIMN